MIIVVSIITSVFLILLLVSFVIYKENLPYEYKKRYLKIKFSDFEKWYLIAPNKWAIYTNCVIRKGGWNCVTHRSYENTECYFNYLDYYRYKIWERKLIKKQYRQKNAERLENLLYAVQNDIDKFKDHIDQENEKAKKEVEKIASRIK